MDSLRADFRNELVDDSDIGEGASGHYLVVSSSGSVLVEVLGLNTSGHQVLGSAGSLGNVSGGGNVVSGDGVSEAQEHSGVLDGHNLIDLLANHIEERRSLDVSGLVVPGEQRGLFHFEGVPFVSSLGDSLVDILEHFGLDDLGNQLGGLFSGRPDVSQENVLSALVLADGFCFEVNVDVTGQSISDDERRRSQVVGSHQIVNSSFEVSVSGKH